MYIAIGYFMIGFLLASLMGKFTNAFSDVRQGGEAALFLLLIFIWPCIAIYWIAYVPYALLQKWVELLQK